MFDENYAKRIFQLSVLVILLSALSFCFIAWQLFVAQNVTLDQYFVSLQGSPSSVGFNSWMRRISFLGSSQFLLPAYLVMVAYYIINRSGKTALVISLTGIGAFLLSSMLKTIVSRPRPLNGLIAHPSTFSFPSGHSTSSLTFFLLLAFFATRRNMNPGFRLLMFCLAVMIAVSIGLSRIYLNVHFPSDVLAGFCVALFWLACMRILYLRLSTRHRLEGT